MSPAVCFAELQQVLSWLLSSADSKPGNDTTSVFLEARNSEGAPGLRLSSCLLEAIPHYSGEVMHSAEKLLASIHTYSYR